MTTASKHPNVSRAALAFIWATLATTGVCLVCAAEDRILVAFSVAHLCLFARGVLIRSFFIPAIVSTCNVLSTYFTACSMSMPCLLAGSCPSRAHGHGSGRQDWRKSEVVTQLSAVWAGKGAMGGGVRTMHGSAW
jgi:hypothetical protein